MIPSLMLVLSLAGAAQAPKAPPQAPAAPELSVLVERVVRLADLQRRKLDLEQQLAASMLGAEHPETIQLRTQLADVTAAIRREGLQAFRSEEMLLTERRIALENELSRLRVGKAHPQYQSVTRQLAAIREQQRNAVVALLAIDRQTAGLRQTPDSEGIHAFAARNRELLDVGIEIRVADHP